jgi:LysM repeat protein
LAGLLAMTVLLCFIGVANAADVLDIGYGAKSISLGRTYAGQKADPYGIFGNPASLKGITTGEAVSMYGQMNTDVSYTMLGYVLPTKYGKFFGGYGNNYMGGFTTTTLDAITGRPLSAGDFDYRNDLFMLGYQNCLSKQISYGLRVKYDSRGAGNISGYSAYGINADAGVLYEASDRLTLGVTARNIVRGELGTIKLSNGQTEALPWAVDAGLGFAAHPKLNLYTDVSVTRAIPAEVKIGAEWKPIDLLAVRLGGEQRSMGGTDSVLNGSAGVGLNMGTFGIDYAYFYDSQLTANSRHFISISVKTPGVTAKERCEDVKAAKVTQPVEVKAEAPKPVETAKPVKEVVKQPEEVRYSVVEGDWLSKIALRYLGDVMRYPEIAELNSIKNPDLIFPGQMIKVRK